MAGDFRSILADSTGRGGLIYPQRIGWSMSHVLRPPCREPVRMGKFEVKRLLSWLTRVRSPGALEPLRVPRFVRHTQDRFTRQGRPLRFPLYAF